MEALDLREAITEASSGAFEEGSPEPFLSLDRLLDAVEETRQLQGLADIAGEALSQPRLDPVRYYLHAFSLIRLGKPDGAVKALVSLCGKMEQEERWGLLSALVPKVLDAAPSVEAARCLAKIGETVGLERLDAETLERAYDLYPDEERLAFLMGERAAAEGRTEEAIGFWAESLDGFAALRRYDRVEEILLKVVESQRPEHQRHVLACLRRFADQHQWARFGSSLELALPGIRGAGLLGDLWNQVLHHFPKAPEEAGLRKWIRTLAPQAFPSAEGILDLLGRSGILDPQIRTETSIKQLETLLEFAPGYRVLHASWGIGRVMLNDGDTLVVDFKETRNHRMKLTLARRALTVVPEDDLRVLQIERPDELRRLVKEQPAEVVIRALRMMKGEASTQDLRRTLTGHGVISTGSWTSWWKEARAALEADDRCDLSQSFRQLYRLSSEGDDLVALPAVEPRRGVRPNLNLIHRFLEQHPDETARASRIYTPILERWARDEKTPPEDRLATHLQLYRWRREVRDDFLLALEASLGAAVEMSAYADPEAQKLLASASLDSEGLWKSGILFVLSSRSAEVREMARKRMERDPEESQRILNEQLRDPNLRPLASLAAIDLVMEETPPEYAPEPWLAALACALMIDGSTKEPIRKQAIHLLSPTGSLAERVRASEVPFGNAERWSVLLRRWRSSERFLQPVLQFLRAVGHGELVDEMRTAHAERTDRILGGAHGSGQTDYTGHIMSKATYLKLLHERNHLVWELRTTVAQAIQKAREFGDLSENAEYDAAKLKQSDFAHRVAGLSKRLAEARLIEDLASPPDEVAPGTEVFVEDASTNEKRILWVLGEGDDWIGENVISYAAPLGRALLGKRAGERVNVVGSDAVHELVIRGITRRLPQPEATAATEEPEVSEQEVQEIVHELSEEETAGGPGV